MKLGTLVGFVAFSLAALVSGSIFGSRQDPPVHEWMLEDGTSVPDLIATKDTVLLLAYRPADLFACASVASAWHARGNTESMSTKLVLVGTPTELERRAIHRARMKVDRVIGLRGASTWVSSEFLYVQGRLVESSKRPNVGRNSSLWRLL